MTEAQTLDGNAFNRLVLEEGLKTWEQNGYVYAGKHGKDGWELYRAYGPKWRMLYQARRVLTQNNAGGGALDLKIRVATGFSAQLVNLTVTGPASATTLIATKMDEHNAISAFLGTIAAGASRQISLPSIGSASTANANQIQSIGLLLGPGEALDFAAAAALQAETMTVGVVLLLPIEATTATVTWDVTGSAGTPVLAASTISAGNTLQAVLLP